MRIQDAGQDPIRVEYPWKFLQQPNGNVLLTVEDRVRMIPCVEFLSPESLRDFIRDGIEAFDAFVPKATRTALAISESKETRLDAKPNTRTD
jgi:hypothetical protein